MRPLALLQLLTTALVAFAAAAACSSTSSPEDANHPTTCESQGLSTPNTGGGCPVGSCTAGPEAGTSLTCCTPVCPTCESEGLVSFNAAGSCPAGTCPSGDVTANLHCCGTTVCGEPPPDAGAD